MVAELLGPVAVHWPLLLIAAIIIATVELVRRWQGWDDEIKEEPRSRSRYLRDALFCVALAALYSWMIYDELHKPTIAWIWLAFLALLVFLMISKAARSLLESKKLSA